MRKLTPRVTGSVTPDVALQPASIDIWDRKYRLKDNAGKPIDASIDATLERVARVLADLESTPELRAHWYDEFCWALRHGAIPAGRILSNAGALDYKPATSTINCTVSSTIRDSMDDILAKLHEGGMTLKSGSGIGYEFSTLRPRGAYVSGADAFTSGPLSFMDIYDKMCFTISSAGGRRGAQMATFDVGHPDVFEFTTAKRESGRLQHFNLSLMVSDAFMAAVETDGQWPLAFPVTPQELRDAGLALDGDDIVWREWPIHEGYITDKQGRVACRVRRVIRARDLWEVIMRSTYDFAEPGFVLIDRINELNNNWFCETIRATNPCGEQPLPPYGACLLGSVNLTCFVSAPFTAGATFDWQRFRRVVNVFTRMLDNVVEINGLGLPEQQHEILRKRRHGMGFLGLGSTLAMLGMRYGDEPSVAFTADVARELALEGWRAALELAREKGPAPIMREMFEVSDEMLARRPEMAADGFVAGDQVSGATLHAKYSRYMQRIAALEPDLVTELAAVGARFTHHSSIAPTGTIALSLANNASNGIEPSFAHHYVRNVIREGKKSKEKVDVYSYELLCYRHFLGHECEPDETVPADLPDAFVTTADLKPEAHIAIQAAAQRWIDSSISKTINVPADYPFEAFKDIYLTAYNSGLKGCTTFRFNPERFQGVLVNNEDLANTVYRFVLEDGTVVEAHGNEEIEYDGETHTAANLYDALKEGYYGKY